jgi:hypothetical protein
MIDFIADNKGNVRYNCDECKKYIKYCKRFSYCKLYKNKQKKEHKIYKTTKAQHLKNEKDFWENVRKN